MRTRFKQFLIWSKAISCRAEIVHIQWASHIYLFEEILDTTYFKIMVSLRGSLINIAPVADDDLLNLYRKTFPRVHLFHAVSEHIKTLATFYGAVEDNIKVIYSGVDLSSFEPLKKKNYFRGDELKILSVGRHHWNKGYNYALEAFSIILKQNIKATYTIIGVSNSEEIICSGNYLDLKDNLILTPYMNYNNVLTAMQTADVLLLPSVSEGVANVAIEAMAIGLPIISTNAAGMPELITHNKTGLLYDNRSINDLVEKLLNFNNMPQKDIENMSENALQKIAQQHNWATFKRAFGDFYKN
ncbi:MAG: glycosyltransferase family 4 protein [Winogradskyella sp.]|uniref:glycosyltransferase family 4 protein n=1 Tax=Winogradskyella sp. TaxID=1883156 RepID=UPI003859C970